MPRPINSHLTPSSRINQEIKQEEGFQTDALSRAPNYARVVPNATKKY